MNLFLILQSVVLTGALMCQQRRAQFTKMNLEWDETGQSMRLRRGLIAVEGVMPVLVPQLTCYNCTETEFYFSM